MGRGRVRGPRHRMQRRVMGTGSPSWFSAGSTQRRWPPLRTSKTICERRVRQYCQNLGILRGDTGLGGGGRAGGPRRLGTGRRLGTEHRAAAFVHRYCVAGTFLIFLSRSVRSMCRVTLFADAGSRWMGRTRPC
jgi:hypothetical protein